MTLETPYRIEPCLLGQPPASVVDRIADLSAASQRLAQGLHPRTASSLAELVRIMNCYYSNLIEGHNTTPREIEQALAGQFEAEEERRNLQIEAKAHIEVQRWVDQQAAAGQLEEPASVAFIQELHRRFYDHATPSMLLIQGNGRSFQMSPGALRANPGEDVSVGRHLPPSSERVPDFMTYFEQQYRFAPLGQGSRIIAMAASHHRLNYIHPFPDGNGRVSRLMSHAMGLQAGIGAHGLWSVSRGLARGLESRGDYKRMMDHADMPRQGSLDGRGNLSQRALEEFVTWFLSVCLDQVRFMESLFALDALSERLKKYVAEMDWKPEAFYLLEAVLIRGELPRGEVERFTGLKERNARNLLSTLVKDGILTSETPKSPVYLAFPIHSIETLFPKLFPVS